MNQQILLSKCDRISDFRKFFQEDGAKNCIEGFKKVAGYAEKKELQSVGNAQ